MSKYFHYSKYFIALSVIAVVALCIAIACCDKIQLHLWLNSCHTPFQDFFWQYYTYIGEWVPYVIVALLLFYKAGWAMFLLADVLLSGGIGQIIKHLVQAPRPITYFAEHAPDVQLPLVEGVPMNEYLSFPSGHTITFFALFMTLSIILSEWYDSHKSTSTSQRSELPTTYYLLPVTCFLLSVLGGYSRIYLSQHFTEDIIGGMLIGTFTTIGLLFIAQKLDNTALWNWNILSPLSSKR